MADKPPNNGAVATLRGPGYDATRVHVGAIFWFIAGLVITLAILLVILWVSQKHWLGSTRDSDRALPTGAPPLAQPLQPSPGPPALPWEDMAALRAAQVRQLQQGGPDP